MNTESLKYRKTNLSGSPRLEPLVHVKGERTVVSQLTEYISANDLLPSVIV